MVCFLANSCYNSDLTRKDFWGYCPKGWKDTEGKDGKAGERRPWEDFLERLPLEQGWKRGGGVW